MNLQLNNINKKHGEKVLFENFDVSFEEGQVTVILGNSGVGKTTLLNILAGLDQDYSGQSPSCDCAYIFQEPRLLKGVTIRKNIELACADKSKADEILIAVELHDYADAYPHQLSGGMAQRAGMARAFAADRPIILMDEPFASLDLGLKHRLYQVFDGLWQIKKPLVVLVTHDLDEALELGDRLIVFKDNPVKIAFDQVIEANSDKEALRERLKELLIN